MRIALLIAGKDLRQRLRDRSALVVAFLAPLSLAAIISLAFGGGGGTFRATFVVADADRGPLAAGFRDLLSSPGLAGVVTPRFVSSAEEARAVVEAGDADAGIVVPPGFSASVQQGGDASLSVLHRRDRPVSGAVAQALADGFASQVSTGQLAVRTAAGLRNAVPPPAEAAQLANRAAGETPVGVTEGPTGKNDFKAASYFGPAMSVFFLFFTVGFGARGFLAERRDGTLARMVAAPIRPWSILLGKALAAFALGLASMLVMWAASTAIFRATWGDPVAVAALIVATLVAVMGVTALVTIVARTDEAADRYASIVSFALAILGGNFFFVYGLPPLLQKVALVTPNGQMLRSIVDLVADDSGIAAVIPALGIILAFGVVTGAAALVRARRLVVG